MKPEIKKQIILHLPYLAFVYLFGKVGQAFRLAQGADLSAKLLHIGQGFSAAFASAAPSFHPTDLLIGLAAAVIIRLVVYSKQKNAKKYRKGMEYGTARWGTAADIKPFIDPVFDNNVLLTQTERLMMSNRPKDPKNARNKNILVIGGSGSGKTRFFCKPNIMQLHSSYVITDPKGSLICEVGQLLQRAKYRIAVLNTINFSKSMHYNPFAYLRTEKDILKLVNTIIVNTKGEGAQSTEDFWVKAERLYYTALIGYIHYEAPEEEKNFITLLDMINASDTREDDEDYKNPVDLLFDRLEEREPEHFAVKQYRKYKLAAGDSLLSAMENAGKEDMPEDAERQGLGTPATRAAMIEKLLSAGFVERKGKSLVPTKDGINLAVILPDMLKSPLLTAEWETRLTEIAKGSDDPQSFMQGIEDMTRELVKQYSHITEDGKKLFAPEKEAVGICPRCKSPVYEGKKNFYCSDRSCRFVMWKNDKFFESRRTVFSKKIAAALLKDGKAKVKGLYSERTGKTYDGTVLLCDTGEKYVNYRIEQRK